MIGPIDKLRAWASLLRKINVYTAGQKVSWSERGLLLDLEKIDAPHPASGDLTHLRTSNYKFIKAVMMELEATANIPTVMIVGMQTRLDKQAKKAKAQRQKMSYDEKRLLLDKNKLFTNWVRQQDAATQNGEASPSSFIFKKLEDDLSQYRAGKTRAFTFITDDPAKLHQQMQRDIDVITIESRELKRSYDEALDSFERYISSGTERIDDFVKRYDALYNAIYKVITLCHNAIVENLVALQIEEKRHERGSDTSSAITATESADAALLSSASADMRDKKTRWKPLAVAAAAITGFLLKAPADQLPINDKTEQVYVDAENRFLQAEHNLDIEQIRSISKRLLEEEGFEMHFRWTKNDLLVAESTMLDYERFNERISHIKDIKNRLDREFAGKMRLQFHQLTVAFASIDHLPDREEGNLAIAKARADLVKGAINSALGTTDAEVYAYEASPIGITTAVTKLSDFIKRYGGDSSSIYERQRAITDKFIKIFGTTDPQRQHAIARARGPVEEFLESTRGAIVLFAVTGTPIDIPTISGTDLIQVVEIPFIASTVSFAPPEIYNEQPFLRPSSRTTGSGSGATSQRGDLDKGSPSWKRTEENKNSWLQTKFHRGAGTGKRTRRKQS